MKKRKIAYLLTAAMLTAMLGGCASSGSGETSGDSGTDDASGGDKETISLWFWGTSDYQRTAMDEYLVNGFNESQDEYQLEVEYRSSVDNDIAVALSGEGGPDIVYGSGPAFVSGYANEGLFVNLDDYAEEYGWKDRLVGAYYDLCTVNGSLYSIPGAMTNYGLFYKESVLEENGWSVPETYDDVITIMDEAIADGMYGGLIGAKDWRYTNEWPVTILMTSVAGPDTLYQCLTGGQAWNSDKMIAAVDEMNTWYQNGYMGGEDYWNLDANETFQILLEGGTPFCYAPLNGFQWAKNVATDESQLEDLKFMPLPAKDGGDGAVSLSAACTFSINSQCANPDGAAAVLDYMLNIDFVKNMSAEWPGYWGLPLVDFADVSAEEFEGVSRNYIETCMSGIEALEEGNFSYAAATCFPANTYEACIDIDTVWFGEQTAEEYLQGMDDAYAEDVDNGISLTLPEPN